MLVDLAEHVPSQRVYLALNFFCLKIYEFAAVEKLVLVLITMIYNHVSVGIAYKILRCSAEKY